MPLATCAKDVFWGNSDGCIALISRSFYTEPALCPVRRRRSHSAAVSAPLCPFFVTSFTQAFLTALFLCFTTIFSLSAPVIALCVFSDGHENITLSLLIGFVEIFATKQFAAKFELSPLNVKNFLGWAVQGKAAPLQNIVKKLEAETGSFTSMLTIADSPLLRKADTEQVL